MAEPPRLPGILLPWDKTIIYFVTMCLKDRRQVLASATVFDAMKETIAELHKWYVLAGIVMPDHAHWIVAPLEDRDLSVGDFSHGFKRLVRKRLSPQSWEWQRGCFDRLLRSDENLQSKWIYVRDNPVRHGFVQRAADWPYYLDFINELETGSCQLPLQQVEYSSGVSVDDKKGGD